MAEYNTLRAEVLAARANVAQAFGVTAPVLIAVVAFSFSDASTAPAWVAWTIAVTAVIYLGAIIIWNEKNTRSFTRRLRTLERQINARAGERLLVWETHSGWGSLFRRRKITRA
jgi:hypothetical protein